MECLRYLRELKADGNRISDLSGIGEMNCLIKLSVVGNRIEKLDLGNVKWYVLIDSQLVCRTNERCRQKLESLNLANNQITTIIDLHRLSAVASVNLGESIPLVFDAVT